jgi:hypothetical protein
MKCIYGRQHNRKSSHNGAASLRPVVFFSCVPGGAELPSKSPSKPVSILSSNS